MSFHFSLSVDETSSAIVSPGDEISVTAALSRTDTADSFPMYAVQYNLYYNSDFFELVPDSVSLGKDSKTGITVTLQKLTGNWDGWTSISASAYSTELEGDMWQNPAELLSFKLKALRVGTSTLLSRYCKVGTSDGLEVYPSEADDVTVTVKTSALPSEDGAGGNTGGSGGSQSGGGSDSSGGSGSSSTGNSGNTTQPAEDPGSQPSGNPTPASPSNPVQKPSERFSDVAAGAWYEDAVSYVLGEELFNGTGSSTFSPDSPMTRAMLVTVLHRLEGTPSPAAGNTFTDVPSGQWYTDAVAWADQNSVVTGYGGGRFGTDDNITRQQLAAVLYRYASLKGYDISASAALSQYRDADSIADWAESAMRWAVSSGVITGMDSSTLSPSGTASRAQVAVMLMRFSDLYD